MSSPPLADGSGTSVPSSPPLKHGGISAPGAPTIADRVDSRLSSSAQGLTLAEIGPEWDARWDDAAGHVTESGFMQSSAWAAFKRCEGYQTVRLGLIEGEK